MIEESRKDIAATGAVLSGPNFAIEIAQGSPTATVIATREEATRSLLHKTFHRDEFHVHTESDVIGVETGGASKNIDAFLLGVSAGQGASEMVQALLAVQFLKESTRMGIAMGAEADTFTGPAYLGDLLLTGRSEQSRNYTSGRELGLGMITIDELLESGRTIEGIYAAQWIEELEKTYTVDLCLKKIAFNILYRDLPVDDGYEQLLEYI
jgi:glycerol-3-phosphate dehydrogenase (NAD(P)+)